MTCRIRKSSFPKATGEVNWSTEEEEIFREEECMSWRKQRKEQSETLRPLELLTEMGQKCVSTSTRKHCRSQPCFYMYFSFSLN